MLGSASTSDVADPHQWYEVFWHWSSKIYELEVSINKAPYRQRTAVTYTGTESSVADPDPGSSVFFISGSGMRKRFFPDPWSGIPNPYFWELSDNFLGKKFFNSLKIGQNFSLQHFKNKIILNFVKFMFTKKVWQLIFFHSSLCCCFWIRDPVWVKIRVWVPRLTYRIPTLTESKENAPPHRR